MYLYTISGVGSSNYRHLTCRNHRSSVCLAGHASSYEDARMVAQLMAKQFTAWQMVAKQLTFTITITFPNGKVFDEEDLPATPPCDESIFWENEHAEDVDAAYSQDFSKKRSGYFMFPPLLGGREIKKG